MIAAQFSIPYVAAAAIVDRRLGTDQFGDARIHDAAIIDLARRVRVTPDAGIDARYPQVTPTRVEVKLKSGEVLRRQVDMPKGDPRSPMSEDELFEKFEHLAGMACDADRVRRIRDFVLSLEKHDDLSPLFALLEAAPRKN